jgi:putative PIN family toxin of toxin-antitoxin system
MRKIIIDTNVLITALLSRNGASYRLLSLVGLSKYDFYISVPLILEYEEQCLQKLDLFGLNENDVKDIIDYMCSTGISVKVYFLWRPFLKDVDDDMILELAVSGGCDSIVTYNVKDFKNVEKVFGIKVVTPKQFLSEIGEI